MKNLIMVSIRFNNNMSENKLTKFNWLCGEYLINPELSRITKFNYGIDTIHLAIELLLLSLRLGKRSPGMITEKFVLSSSSLFFLVRLPHRPQIWNFLFQICLQKICFVFFLLFLYRFLKFERCTLF